MLKYLHKWSDNRHGTSFVWELKNNIYAHPNAPLDIVGKALENAEDFSDKQLAAILKNPALPAAILAKFIENNPVKKEASIALASNPSLPPEILADISEGLFGSSGSMEAALGNPNIPEEVLRDWARNFGAYSEFGSANRPALYAALENPNMPSDALMKLLYVEDKLLLHKIGSWDEIVRATALPEKAFKDIYEYLWFEKGEYNDIFRRKIFQNMLKNPSLPGDILVKVLKAYSEDKWWETWGGETVADALEIREDRLHEFKPFMDAVIELWEKENSTLKKRGTSIGNRRYIEKIISGYKK